VLENALAKLLGERVGVIGAGRTDAGVHATGQVISFRTANPLPEGTIERGVNALLPADVAVSDVAEADAGFHARYSATSRTYAYRIWNSPRPRPLLRRTAWWVSDALAVAEMQTATRHLVGRRDFSAFAMKTVGIRERAVRRAAWSAGEDGLLAFEIEADGFLRGMVRGIVGTLAQVGRGKLDAAAFADVVVSADRERGGPSAPPHGLCLVRVAYDGPTRDRAYHEPPGTDEEDE
jgi:tRNA pseudouridine38-40 synthase